MIRNLPTNCASATLALAVLTVVSSRANANLPPATPAYLFEQSEGEWMFADRLHWESKACTADLCEAGFHQGDFVITAVRSKAFVQIVAGFKDCESTSWNNVDLDETPASDRPAVVRYLASQLVKFAAEACKRDVPNVSVPEMSGLFANADR